MKRKISIFIASPGDLANERNIFREIISDLNKGFGDGANVEFVPLGWEDTLASTGRRNQSVINEEIDRCDVFILAMHRRWGQPAPDAGVYTSYTEEEFYRALTRWQDSKKPEIFVFFKRVDAASEADPGVQLQKVMNFRKQLEETRKVLYHYFEDENSFAHEVSKHLRAYAKGELPKTESIREAFMLPSAVLEEVEKAKSDALKQAAEAKAARNATNEAYLRLAAMQLQMAQDAADLSLQGKIEYARQKFSVLVSESSEIKVLSLACDFFTRIGDLSSAISAAEKLLSIAGVDSNSSLSVGMQVNLGNLYQTRGEWSRAEKIYRKAMEMAELIDDKKSIGWCLSSLGVLYQARGELDRAEEMFKKSLNVAELANNKLGIAADSGNLAVIYNAKGEYEQAEKMFNRSIAVASEINDEEMVGNAYLNLANLYSDQQKFFDAETTYKKALLMKKRAGHKEGISTAYSGLASLYLAQGKLDLAERKYKQSLSIEKEMGRKAAMISDYVNLGNIYARQKFFPKAEKEYLTAIALGEEIGVSEKLATSYYNLGLLYINWSNLERAKEMLEKSLSLYLHVSSSRSSDVKKILDALF